MDIGKNVNINDNIHDTIYMTDFEKRISSTTLFNRLHYVYQNSTVYLTFPSNQTKRYEHSFGTMELCSQIFFHSICNSAQDDLERFFALADEALIKIVEGIEKNSREYSHKLGEKFKVIKDAYKRLEVKGGIFNSLSPLTIVKSYHSTYCILLESIRIAALLHDVGHPPFSHIVEGAMKNIYDELKKKKTLTSRQDEFVKILDNVYSNQSELHENISFNISEKLLYQSIKNISEDDARKEDVYSKQLFEILVKECVVSIFKSESGFFKDLHAVIDGPLDGDRLDYVTRDVNNSGISAGKIEYKRIIPTVRIQFINDDAFVFCPSTKVINSIDDFFSRRWDLYKKIVYHHRAIKTDYLLSKSVEDISLNYLCETAERDESSNNLLPNNISGLWKALEDKWSKTEFAYSVVQWDDNWLLTVLKKHYFLTYIEKSYNHTTAKLDEFLTNKKRYYTIIKETANFLPLDIEFAKIVEQNIEVLRKMVAQAIELVALFFEDKDQKNDDLIRKYSEIRIFLYEIEDFVKYSYRISESKTISLQNSEGFLLSKAKYGLFKFQDILKVSFDEFISNHCQSMKNIYERVIEDIFFVSKKANSGLSKTLYLYEQMGPNKVELREYSKISSMQRRLDNEINLFPPFFIFIMHKESFDISTVYHEKFCKKLGEVIGETFVSLIQTTLKEINTQTDNDFR